MHMIVYIGVCGYVHATEDNLGCVVLGTGSLSCFAAFAGSAGSEASTFSCVHLSCLHRSAGDTNVPATIFL